VTFLPAAQPLWEAVLALPLDDAPRRVLADWLQEHGDPRGEFIALQCQLAATEPDERGVDALALEERCRMLLNEHGPAWLEGWPLDRVPDFERGFPHHLAVPSHEIGEHLPRMLAAAPTLRAVTLNDKDPMLWRSGFAKFLAARGVEQLRSLSMPVVNGPSDVTALASARSLARLEALTFQGGLLGRAGIQALVQAAFRASLRELTFEFDAGWGERWPEELGAFALTRFHSRANVVGDVAAAFPNLQTLKLSATPLRNAAGLSALQKLTTLELDDVQLSRKGLSALGQGFKHVRRFALSRQPKALGVLNERWPALESVDLRGTVLGDDGVRSLVDRPWALRLKRLVLADNGLTDVAAKTLAEGPLPQLKRLDVSGNALSKDALARLERRGWLVVS
jgi:uncharacterized protein (TIGR02996 family)